MPKIKIEKNAKLPAQDAFGKLKSFFDNDKDLRKLDSNYKCHFNESNLTGTAMGSKFEALVTVKPEGTGSRIVIEISLPLMLSPFKGFVEKTVQDKITALLG